jgi:hypothetical protein
MFVLVLQCVCDSNVCDMHCVCACCAAGLATHLERSMFVLVTRETDAASRRRQLQCLDAIAQMPWAFDSHHAALTRSLSDWRTLVAVFDSTPDARCRVPVLELAGRWVPSMLSALDAHASLGLLQNWIRIVQEGVASVSLYDVRLSAMHSIRHSRILAGMYV